MAMPVPSNLTPGTATNIPSLPFTQTVLAADWALAPTNNSWPSTCDTNGFHDLWWKYTTGPAEHYISVSGDSPGAAQDDPRLSIWTFVGTVGTQYKIVGSATTQNYCNILGGKFWMEMAVIPSTTYYFQYTTINNSTPTTSLTVYLQGTSPLLALKGAIAITDDDDDRFPITVLDRSTGEILQLLPFPGGEFADCAPSGEVCTQNGVDNTAGVLVYRKNLSTVLGAGSSGGDPIIGIKSNHGPLFYYISTPVDHDHVATVRTIDINGVVGGTVWTLPANSINARAFAVSRDNSKLYYSTTTSPLSQGIHVFDLVNNIALPNLMPPEADIAPVARGDGFAYSDGSVFICFSNIAGTPVEIRRYSSSGTLIQTYPLPSANGVNHYALDRSDDLHFWVWFNRGTFTQVSDFKKIRISDGVQVATFSVHINQATGSPWDAAPFTVADSCPLLILSQDLPVPVPPVVRLSGLFMLDRTATHDIYYGDGTVDKVDKKIPDPTIRTALIGE